VSSRRDTAPVFQHGRASVSRLLVTTVALVCALCVEASPAAADPPALYVIFRADHTFLAYLPASGAAVGTTSGAPSLIPAGTYKLLLDDTSETDMQFDLAGPGVKLVTDMSHAEDPSAAFLETFQPSSTYTYRDDNHPSVLWTFVTSAETIASSGTGVTTTSPTQSPKSSGTTSSTDVVGSGILPYRGKLAATVSAAGKLALAFKGKSVGKLKAGRYTITVVDQSSSRGFTLQQLRKRAQAMTGTALVGTRSRTVTLAAGQWLFFSPGGAKNYFIVVGV
jgi:uncharacterized protein YbjQ (UPF0145 family)